jgi:hypothetical protein
MAIIKVRNPAIDLDAAEIPNLDAAKITSGTFADARIAASNVTQHASSYIDWQSVKTSNFNAVAGKGYPVNTTGGAITATLPGSANTGDTIKFVDYSRTFSTNALTINQNSLKFQGNTSPNPSYNTTGQAITCTYIDSTQGWIPTVDDDVSLETPQAVSLQYLVIAGGGAGGGGHRSGGGGAGGYRNSYASETSGRNASTETPWTINPGTVVTVTVGAGGAVSDAANGGKGGDSSISASGQTTITSYGGGGGGEYQSSADAGTYGSGGGAGHYTNNQTNGSNGTAGQGFDGGDVTVTNAIQQGGCGGGASENGAGGGTTSPSTGGAGLSSSITGSAVTRAGGGGAGGYDSGGFGSGGAGGGGNGGSDNASDPHSGVVASGSYYHPTSGTDNTGGGGGGTAHSNNTTTYGRGGSGVVILRVPASDYTGTTSGSPTVSTVGSDKVMVFNSSGSYTT